MARSGQFYSGPFCLWLQLDKWTGMTGIRKFFDNADVGTSFEDLWASGGVLSQLTSAETLNIASNSTEDDVGQTGATEIYIEGVDGSYATVSETVTMDGTSNVLTSNSYLRVQRMRVTGASTAETNVGHITATASTAATVQGCIAPGDGQSTKSQYTVPAGYTGIITDVWISASKGDNAQADLQVKPFGEAWQLKSRLYLYESQTEHSFDAGVGILIPEKSDIRIQAKALSGGTSALAGSYSIILIDNTEYELS